jgi:hypothetical protein
MNTIKLATGMFLVTLAAVAFGQLASNEGQFRLIKFGNRICGSDTRGIACFTADRRSERSGIEKWMYDLSSWASAPFHQEDMDAPVISRTILIGQANLVIEAEPGVEDWMTIPFGNGTNEERVAVEPWMAAPFESAPAEEELAVEPWMAAPFESAPAEEELAVEPWMAAPFESAPAEEELAVEPWMTAPFESAPAEEELAVEPWMTSPFESAPVEEELAVEPWMTAPFESALAQQEPAEADFLGEDPCTKPDSNVSFPFKIVGY